MDRADVIIIGGGMIGLALAAALDSSGLSAIVVDPADPDERLDAAFDGEPRRRLARELHDETIQSLIALGHRIEMVQKALDKDPERARQRLAELSQLVNETQQEVRRFSRALRPLYLEDLGLVPALEMLAQEVEQQSDLVVSVALQFSIIPFFPRSILA